MSRADRNTLVRALRLKGVVLEVVGDHVRVDTPKGVVTPEVRERLETLKPRLVSALLEEREVLALSLKEFERQDRAIEIRVSWLAETLWLVPHVKHVATLVRQQGIARGRIWTARELDDLLSIPAITGEDIQKIGRVKAIFGADIVSVRPDCDTGDGS